MSLAAHFSLSNFGGGGAGFIEVVAERVDPGLPGVAEIEVAEGRGAVEEGEEKKDVMLAFAFCFFTGAARPGALRFSGADIVLYRQCSCFSPSLDSL